MSLGGGSENCVCYLRLKNWFTRISICYHKATISITLGQLKMLQRFIANVLFKHSYFPYTILEWNKLDIQIRRSESFLSFKDSFRKVGRATAKPIYNIHNPSDLKFLARLTLGLSHLNEHKFKHNFQDCVNSLCSCSLEIEFVSHFFRHCHHFINLVQPS